MRWSMAGDQAILDIRSLIKSGRFDKSWEYIVEELKKRDPTNGNWNPWKEKRRPLDQIMNRNTRITPQYSLGIQVEYNNRPE